MRGGTKRFRDGNMKTGGGGNSRRGGFQGSRDRRGPAVGSVNPWQNGFPSMLGPSMAVQVPRTVPLFNAALMAPRRLPPRPLMGDMPPPPLVSPWQSVNPAAPHQRLGGRIGGGSYYPKNSGPVSNRSYPATGRRVANPPARFNKNFKSRRNESDRNKDRKDDRNKDRKDDRNKDRKDDKNKEEKTSSDEVKKEKKSEESDKEKVGEKEKSDKNEESSDKSGEKDEDEKTIKTEKDEDKEKITDTMEKDEDKNTEKDEDKKSVKTEVARRSERTEDNFPSECLYCHICDLADFQTRRGYVKHLEGASHSRMAEIFHAKNAATLELLSVSSQLAIMRQKDKILRKTGKRSYNRDLEKTTEEILMQKYTRPNVCCGMRFVSPFDLEEHKLTVKHLKEKYMQKNEKSSLHEKRIQMVEEQIEEIRNEIEEKGDDFTGEERLEKESELEKKIELVDIFKKEQEIPEDELYKELIVYEDSVRDAAENPLTITSIPVYDPTNNVGAEYLLKELRFRCDLCKTPTFKSLHQHCKSFMHYESVMAHLNKQQAKAKEEELKKKEKERKESENKLKEEKNEKEIEEIFKAAENNLPILEEAIETEEDHDVITIGEDEERIMNSNEEENIFQEVGDSLDEVGDNPAESNDQEESNPEPVVLESEDLEPVVLKSEDPEPEPEREPSPKRARTASARRSRGRPLKR